MAERPVFRQDAAFWRKAVFKKTENGIFHQFRRRGAAGNIIVHVDDLIQGHDPIQGAG